MLHYKIYQNKSKGNKAYGKWFARAAVNQTIDLEQLAEHMANHNTADDPNVFSPTKNIKSVHLRARSTGDLTRAVLTAAAKVTRADTYDPSANAIEDETGTETETPTDPDGKSVNP